ANLQLELSLPPAARENPWKNLFDPAMGRHERPTDEAVLAYVRRSNYFDDEGRIALRAHLEPLAPEWDGQGDGRWDGFVPDAWFDFDGRGFDRKKDGTLTGWRAFAYAPFPGAFLPTNGSADDVLIRLDPALRENRSGEPDRVTYEINLAIVEAL